MTVHVGKASNKVKFQLDPGSQVNTLCEKYVHDSCIQKTSKTLKSWDGSLTQALGESKLLVTNPKSNKQVLLKFVIVPNDRSCLLGMKTCESLNFVSINRSEFMVGSLEGSLDEKQLVMQYPSVFDGKLGTLAGKVTLRMRDGAVPKVVPARNIPFAIKDEVHGELLRLVELGVIKPVDIPTPWVSQMVCARKPTGKLRVCIDPAELNHFLLREHYRLPTMEDVLDKFSEANIFAKFDVENAYWHCELDYESSLLTTMATPWGRFRWLRLPFGLSVSGEIFQRKLSEALSGLQSVTPVADDIALFGKGNTHHDESVHELLQRCEEKRIKLKADKMEVRRTEMKFHGHQFTTNGMKPDESKITALRDMPPPTDVAGVLRFCGLAQYLSRFMPNLSDEAAPLRALTHKGTVWKWTEVENKAFETIKKLACEAPILAHYNPKEPLILQTDASSHGLGAVMIQDGRPVAYASRALNEYEQGWAQIEKECLSVLFGLERFDQYTYGREVIVENDHKPLESILQKPLSARPKRLQAMGIFMNRYVPGMIYKPGPKMVLADALSRAYPHLTEAPDSHQFEKINSLLYLPVSEKRIAEIRDATENDSSMQILIKVIHEGWPESRDKVPVEALPYYAIRDTLSFQDGIVLKGERLVIPEKLRPDIKKKMHMAHLGTSSMLRRAREIVYWPNMNSEIQQMAESCDICQNMTPRQCKEPLIPRDKGSRPWQNVGCDLFSIHNRQYMVTVDYYSNFWEVDFLTSTSASAVILALKRHFARYGVPEIFVSDCQPFDSDEFKLFAKDYGFEHDPSSPGLSESNGMAESAVKAAKRLMRKCAAEKSDPYKAILELRNTPIQGINLSPVQIMMQRRTRSVLPCSQKLLQPRVVDPVPGHEKRVATQKRYYDKNSNPLHPLLIGQPVRFDKFDSTRRKAVWEKGHVISHDRAPRSYNIQGESRQFRRNRLHIIPDKGTPPLSSEVPHASDPTQCGPSVGNPDPCPPTLDSPKKQPHLSQSPEDINPDDALFSEPQADISSPSTGETENPLPPRTRRPPSYLNDYDCS